MPGDPGFGRGPDLRLMAAKQRSMATRKRIMQPEMGGGGDFGPARAPTRRPPPAIMQMKGGDDWGLSGLLSGPGNFVRDTIGDKAMNVIKQVGPATVPGLGQAYQASRLLPGGAFDKVSEAYGDVVTDPYSYLGGGFGGAATRSVRGLGFLERLLSKAPKAAKATGDRGPVNPALAQHLLSSEINKGMYPLQPRPRPAFPGNPLDPRNRETLQDMIRGADMDPGLMGAMNNQADELPNMLAPVIPRRPHGYGQQDIDELEVAMAHDDPLALEEMMMGGIGTPQMGGQQPEADRLARMMMEELGGTKPRMTRWGEQSLQGLAPFGALGGLGTYGWQRQQQPQRPIPQRRRPTPMLAENWR